MDLKLNGKKALIFGSTGGIGKAVAISMINEGVEVYINGRSNESCERACKEIGAAGFYAGDLSEERSARKIVDSFIADHQRLDILVTNTGGPQKGNFSEVTLEQWKTDYQSLWLSVINCCQRASSWINDV